jgi:hypothetical protein
LSPKEELIDPIEPADAVAAYGHAWKLYRGRLAMTD